MAPRQGLDFLKILVVDPHSGIRSHFRQMHQMAVGLADLGHEVAFLSCAGVMKFRCNVAESFGRPLALDANPRDCERCIGNLNSYQKLSSEANITWLDADEILAPIREVVDLELEAVRSALRSHKDYTSPSTGVTPTNLALYETFLRFKLSSNARLTPDQVEYQLAFALNACIMSHVAKRLSEQYLPEVVLAFSPQYSAVGSIVEVFESLAARTYFVESSAALNERYSHVRIWDWTEFGLANPRMEDFDPAGALNAGDSGKLRINGHFEIIEKGASFSVYSPKGKSDLSPRSVFEIPAECRYALLSMSSSDELRAAQVIGRFESPRNEPTVFPSQIEWLEETIAWFKDRPEVYLVVRPHPRDFSTQREPEVAQHAATIASVLKNLPPNVVADIPSAPLPLWSYFKEVSALITGWSSTALEALHNGVPVVTYDSKITSFPATLSTSGSSRIAYFENLETAMFGKEGLVPQREQLTKWMFHNYFSQTIELMGRPFEASRVKYRFLDRVLNGIDYFAPRVFDVFENMLLNSKKSRSIRVSASKQIAKEMKISND